MNNPNKRWLPILSLEPLDAEGRLACEVLRSNPRYVYFFRTGLGHHPTRIACCVGQVDALTSVSVKLRADPNRIWLLVSEGLYTLESRSLAGTVILIPAIEISAAAERLIGFISFVMELLLASDWGQFPVWERLYQTLIEASFYGIAVPSCLTVQAVSPAFDGVAVVEREGQGSMKQILQWAGELTEIATTETTSLMLWGGHPAKLRLDVQLFPVLWTKVGHVTRTVLKPDGL